MPLGGVMVAAFPMAAATSDPKAPSRLAPALADVVSTIDLLWPGRRGVRLSRADGSGLRLRPADLAACIGPALAPQLAEHPAATAEFLEALQEASARRSIGVMQMNGD